MCTPSLRCECAPSTLLVIQYKVCLFLGQTFTAGRKTVRARQRGSLNDGSPLQECLAENDRDWRACQKGVPHPGLQSSCPPKGANTISLLRALHLYAERLKPGSSATRRRSRGGRERMQSQSSDEFAPCKGPILRLGPGKLMKSF